MRIAFAPNFHRINPYQRLLADALRKRGIEVEMVDFNPADKFPLLGLVSRLKNRCDALHIHWLHREYANNDFLQYRKNLRRLRLELIWLKLFGKLPLFYTAHNLYGHDARLPDTELALHRKLVLLSRNTFVHGTAAHRRLIDAYRLSASDQARLVEIEHGNFHSIYGNSPSRTEARQKLGLSEDAVIFLAFGAVRGYKSLSALLKTFTRWPRANAVLLIVGPVLDRNVLAELEVAASSDPRVLLKFGHWPDHELPSLFAAVDASVIAYDWQLTSSVLILSMGFGKPLLLPNRDLSGESPPLEGNIVATEGWTSAFEKFARLPDAARAAMGNANKSTAASLSWDCSAATIASAYRECLVTHEH